MRLLSKITQLVKRQTAVRAGENKQWPFFRGPYFVVDATAAVVVTTLGNEKLAGDLAALAPPGLCMSCPLTGGRAEIERLAHTLIANLSIQHLVCAGEEPRKPATLVALKALFHASADELAEAMEASGTSKMRLSAADVAALRKQVQFSDMQGCNEIDQVVSRVRELSTDAKRRTTGFVAPGGDAPNRETRVIAADDVTHDLVSDKAGDFKISIAERCIVVEHYNKKDELLRVIEGARARSICLTLIRNGWISKLDHAAYLGRELSRAESALRHGEEFIQDADSGIAAG
jgi:tetrahydromethanopterin S-methyltransferase subunit A